MDHHRYSFFGQKVGLLLDSAHQCHSNLYLRFIKKKNSGIWEKPSAQEGKVIKFNLIELLSIIKTLDHPGSKWTTVHRFKSETTPITVEHKGKNVLFLIPGYQKYLNLAESDVLVDLLKHIYTEKLTYATSGQISGQESHTSNQQFIVNSQQTQVQSSERQVSEKRKVQAHSESYQSNQNIQELSQVLVSPSQKIKRTSEFNSFNVPSSNFISTLSQEQDFYFLNGNIEARSQRALAFRVENRETVWIPLSCVREAVNDENSQGIWVKKWFVEKKFKED